jgi:hypothetical protein
MNPDDKGGKIQVVRINTNDIKAAAAGEQYFHEKQITYIKELVIVLKFLLHVNHKGILPVNIDKALKKKFIYEIFKQSIVLGSGHVN